MGNILYKKWVVFVTQKRFGYREKGVYLPIVLYLSTSKILPQIFTKSKILPEIFQQVRERL